LAQKSVHSLQAGRRHTCDILNAILRLSSVPRKHPVGDGAGNAQAHISAAV
jgi:hypothetical protein